jgi:tetratricopeptide (TPR) repeat protein
MKRICAVALLTILLAGMLAVLAACGASSQTADDLFEAGNDLTTRANEALMAGQEQEAAQLYLQAEQAYKDGLAQEADTETRIDLYVNLGVVHYQLGRLDDAIASYQAALELAPSDADVHSNLGAAYVQKALEATQKQRGQDVITGFWEQARGAYQTAVDLNPTLAQAHFGLGVIHMQLAEKEAAIAAFEAFQEHDTGADPWATQEAARYLEELKTAP